MQSLQAENSSLRADLGFWEEWQFSPVEVEVRDRLAVIEPAIAEKVKAAKEERQPSIPGEQRLRRNVAEHIFSKNVCPITDALSFLRKAQRGQRKGNPVEVLAATSATQIVPDYVPSVLPVARVLKADSEIVPNAVPKVTEVLQTAELQANGEIVLAAVSTVPSVERDQDADLRADREIVLLSPQLPSLETEVLQLSLAAVPDDGSKVQVSGFGRVCYFAYALLIIIALAWAANSQEVPASNSDLTHSIKGNPSLQQDHEPEVDQPPHELALRHA